ncbi:MAG: 16S rRNA (guanine(966)-N(2))-methyltransferase RsmD [Coriobacteriia bacterium]|nr:16S rRNA (guanine(966)-N(2))-methyltransferase RsmD [Coriobacteriia bacterium]
MTRVIAGLFKGRQLLTLPGTHTRPTTDRAREAWASSIATLREDGFVNARVLDAFAGSGALGIEAISRGASHATFADNDQRAIQVIIQNLRSLEIADNPQVRVIKANMLSKSFVGRLMRLGPYDCVFLDPPYAYTREDIGTVLSTLIKNNLLANGCIVSYERHVEKPGPGENGADPSARRWLAGLKMVSCKQYGNSAIEYYLFDQELAD